MTYDASRLHQLGRRHTKLRDELRTLVPALADEIRAASAAGLAQKDIVTATGYTRDQIRQICLPADRRRTRRAAEYGRAPYRTNDQNSELGVSTAAVNQLVTQHRARATG